jgi:hypothetical protein
MHMRGKLAEPQGAGQADSIARAAQRRFMLICKGLRYAHVAQQTGYHPETVRRYLRGAGRVPYDFVVRLALMQRVNPRWLMTGKGSASLDDPRGQALGEVSLAELLGEIATRLASNEAHMAVSAVLADGPASAAMRVDAHAPAAASPRLATNRLTERGSVTAEAKPPQVAAHAAPKPGHWGPRTATARLVFERAG